MALRRDANESTSLRLRCVGLRMRRTEADKARPPTETASLHMLVLRTAGPIRACVLSAPPSRSSCHGCSNHEGEAPSNAFEFLRRQLALIGSFFLIRHDSAPFHYFLS
jgi:hypothetical protein